MGIRDSMRFNDWFRKKFETESESHQEQTPLYTKKDIEEAYEAGFDNGMEACRSYDPKWDAD